MNTIYKIRLNIIFTILLLMVVIPFVQSAPPVTETLARGVDIVHPDTMYVKSGKNMEINFWTYQATDGQTLTNATLNCTVYLINSQGVNFYRFSNNAGANGLITYGKGAPLCTNCWTMTMPKENLSVGVYSYQIKCQGKDLTSPTPLNVGGYETGGFEVTNTGVILATGDALLYIAILTLLVVLFMACIYKFFTSDSIALIYASLSLSYFLLISIVFISSQIVNNFIATLPAIGQFLDLTLTILIIGIFPIIIFMIIYTINTALQKKEEEGLMSMGYTAEESRHYRRK